MNTFKSHRHLFSTWALLFVRLIFVILIVQASFIKSVDVTENQSPTKASTSSSSSASRTENKVNVNTSPSIISTIYDYLRNMIIQELGSRPFLYSLIFFFIVWSQYNLICYLFWNITPSYFTKRIRRNWIPHHRISYDTPFIISLISLIFTKVILANEKRGCLPINMINRVIHDATNVLNNRKLIFHLNPIIGSKIIVIGDLHGNIVDLLFILMTNGLPSKNNNIHYIFNGDLVDRGKNSMEVLILALSLLLTYPDRIFINRGNHESITSYERYGFESEVETRYKELHWDDEFILRLENLFSAMPWVIIVKKQVFIAHAGFPLSNRKSFQIGSIEKCPRHLDPFDNNKPDEANTIGCRQYMMDILWSDPVDVDGIEINYNRMADSRDLTKVYKFGPDVTERFLRQNEFRFIIRSHEEVNSGFSSRHNGHLITVFSSSNYPGSSRKDAAYLILKEVQGQIIYKGVSYPRPDMTVLTSLYSTYQDRKANEERKDEDDPKLDMKQE